MTDEQAAPPTPDPAPAEPTASAEQTAQIPVSEPLPEVVSDVQVEPAPAPAVEQPALVTQDEGEVAQTPTLPVEPVVGEIELPEVEVEALQQSPSKASQPEPPAHAQSKATSSYTSPEIARELLKKARATTQLRKLQKLNVIMTAIDTGGRITNHEVQVLLKCSDATATRYLSILVKQGKIRKVGMRGAGVSYVKA